MSNFGSRRNRLGASWRQSPLSGCYSSWAWWSSSAACSRSSSGPLSSSPPETARPGCDGSRVICHGTIGPQTVQSETIWHQTIVHGPNGLFFMWSDGPQSLIVFIPLSTDCMTLFQLGVLLAQVSCVTVILIDSSAYFKDIFIACNTSCWMYICTLVQESFYLWHWSQFPGIKLNVQFGPFSSRKM